MCKFNLLLAEIKEKAKEYNALYPNETKTKNMVRFFYPEIIKLKKNFSYTYKASFELISKICNIKMGKNSYDNSMYILRNITKNMEEMASVTKDGGTTKNRESAKNTKTEIEQARQHEDEDIDEDFNSDPLAKLDSLAKNKRYKF